MPDKSSRDAGALVRPGASAMPPADVKVLEADALLAGAREILIAHRGDRYRLRLTQNGKLILTK